MASVTILSDNGATSGSAGLKTSGGNDGTMLLQTTTSGGTPTTAISISNTQVVTYTNQPTYTGGTANGVLYLNGSKAVTSGTALVFDGANLGVGVTPSAWVSSIKAIQFGPVSSLSGDTGSASFNNNSYYNGTNHIYLTSAAASQYYQNNGAHYWRYAASGTQGNSISYTQAMTLDASGNLGIGVTSPRSVSNYKVLDIGGTTGGIMDFYGGSTRYATLYGDSGGLWVGTLTSSPITFNTNDTERARIDSSGNFAIGLNAAYRGRLYVNSGSSQNCLALQSTTSGVYLEFADNVTPTWGNSPKIGAFTNDLVFSTTGSERARITSGGDFCINTTSSYFGSKLTVVQDNGEPGMLISNDVTGGRPTLTFYNREIANPAITGQILFSGFRDVRNPSYSAAILGYNYSSGLGNTGRITINVGSNGESSISSLPSAVLTIDPGGLTVTGSLSKSSGSFKIDHPLPEMSETHHLVHSFVEAPQADNLYRGKATLVAGTAQVNIDEAAGMTAGTFVLLNREVQCFTTNETGWVHVRGSVTGNVLTIEAQDSTCTDTISWMVIGERKDKHMYDTEWTDENGKVIVEPLKEIRPTPEERA